MKKFFAWFVVIAAYCACNDEIRPVQSSIPPNRAKIVNYYTQIDSLLYGPTDSLEVHLARMKSAATHEPTEYKAMVDVGYGILYLNRASNVLAMKHYNKALKQLHNTSATDTLIARAETGIGSTLKNTGDYPEAFKHLFKALKIYEQRNDAKGIAITNGTLAQIYLQKDDIPLAKEHLLVAMNAMQSNKAHYAYLNAAHTLANIHGMNGDFTKALAVDEEGIKIARSIPSMKLASPFLDNKAACFMFSDQLDSAQYYYNECLKMDLKIGNQKQVADSYSNLAHLAMLKKNFPEAEAMALKSIEILQQNDHKFNLHKSYDILSKVYKTWRKPEKALAANEKFLETYKKMMDEKKEAALAEFKIVHETENKEREIAENRVRLLESERVAKRRSSLLIGTSILAAFLAITGWLIYRQQRLKNLQQEQEHELKTAIIHIENQNKLQEQRLNISRDLHDNIGAQLTFIMSSVDNIKYAFDLKDTQLETRLQSINSFTQATIIELRDTIWAMNNSEIKFEDLRTRIYNFVGQATNARKEIAFSFSIDEKMNDMKMTSIVGMNIYRTIQEAIHNAIKHSGASKISIDIKNVDSQLEIVISDNGNGFNNDAVRRGNGISNMTKRIEDINGVFSISSSQSHGTTVVIVINLDTINLAIPA